MSWRHYHILIQNHIADEAEWDSAADANPNDPQSALRVAVMNSALQNLVTTHNRLVDAQNYDKAFAIVQLLREAIGEAENLFPQTIEAYLKEKE